MESEVIRIFAIIGTITIFYLLLRLIGILSAISLYITASFSGTPVNFLDLIAMKFRKVNPKPVVNSFITLRKSGISVEIFDLELTVLKGHDLNALTEKLIRRKKGGESINVKEELTKLNIINNN